MDQATDSGFGLKLPAFVTVMRESQRLRLATLVRLRWLSVAGQTAACVFVAWGLWWPFPIGACLALIAVSVALNLYLSTQYAASQRLSSTAAAAVLTFDILQPSGLMYLTGGIHNPFMVFLVVPAIIASATQPPLTVVALSVLAVLTTTILAFFHMPLPWPTGDFFWLPPSYVGGLWFAIVTTLVFSAIYIYRVAAEARALADALSATELVLQREQHISALDGLAAAAAHELGTPLATIALVAKDMDRSVGKSSAMREDVDLLVEQSERCRAILRRLSSLSSSSESHLARLPLLSLIDEVAEPHRNFGIALEVEAVERDGPEPVARRNAGIVYGLGNIVENAVDFAGSTVIIRTGWDEEVVRISILDDGPGFSPEVLARIGDPYMSDREPTDRRGGGLGLGLFIAKTLLERSGATIAFSNRGGNVGGASVTITWPLDVYLSSRSPSRD
ncbi:ActS/PrrB/RegB family redox-sensitive histidine kinase [Aurantimonas sp. VKM B-3413]|uniref:ActS/PrrB/RegB family redox-sensitive histidine kinase n=1 Tax=Aurantimonas sp. VKM B-3413 TaxID=2779401 RepID=UPI001E40B0DD|nr:ActS/PrrB/RegB family redox-sensitive histidine kinase [Aurantimonas sp. VKM B-3413]MCB8837262.1 ActS/PrrB/RegB family redox-sensitive histidine kinase [Aurantimonas sp. VKM B-3413]